MTLRARSLGCLATERSLLAASRHAAWAFALLLLMGPLCQASAAEKTPAPPDPSLQSKPDGLPGTIEGAASTAVSPRKLSGLAVPNDVEAAELMAVGFRLAAGNRYDKIVILFPDHVAKPLSPFATTLRSFDTAFGPVEASHADISRLLQDSGGIEESELLAGDPGILGVLLYVRHFFPGTPVVPIAVTATSRKDDWDRLVAALDGVVTARTLILQTTDTAPPLPREEARARDQEFLNVLAAADSEAAALLMRPRSTDSGGAQYVQMQLQAQRFHARPLVTAHVQLDADPAKLQSTSAMVQIYPGADEAGIIAPSDPSLAETYCFAGDTFFGRNMLKVLSNKGTPERLRKEVRRRLAGCSQLILNLEGVVVERMPRSPGVMTLAMPKTLTLDWLEFLNVAAVSVANNHRNDMGNAGFAAMVDMLEANGIKAVRHGDIADLGRFRLVTLTDLDNIGTPFGNRITEEELEAIGRAGVKPPLLAFVHWGVEWQTVPTQRQIALAERLSQEGVSLIVGAHSHRALPHFTALGGGQATVAYSLGNFLFDQFNRLASGSILEVRFFADGTFFVRLVEMPNFFHHAIGRR